MLLKEAKLLEQKLQDVIDENEALRKGMHEILDSVRCHDGKTVRHRTPAIKFQTVEENFKK